MDEAAGCPSYPNYQLFHPFNMSETNGRATTKVILEYIRRDIDEIKRNQKEAHASMSDDIHDLRTLLAVNYVNKEVFDIRVGRLEKILYSIVGLVFTAFIGALIGVVFVP